MKSTRKTKIMVGRVYYPVGTEDSAALVVARDDKFVYYWCETCMPGKPYCAHERWLRDFRADLL